MGSCFIGRWRDLSWSFISMFWIKSVRWRSSRWIAGLKCWSVWSKSSLIMKRTYDVEGLGVKIQALQLRNGLLFIKHGLQNDNYLRSPIKPAGCPGCSWADWGSPGKRTRSRRGMLASTSSGLFSGSVGSDPDFRCRSAGGSRASRDSSRRTRCPPRRSRWSAAPSARQSGSWRTSSSFKDRILNLYLKLNIF